MGGGTLADQLSSVAGIVAMSVVAVRIALRSLARVKFARTIPTWVYAAVAATGLTLFARFVLHSIEGDIWDLMYRAVTNAAMANGVTAWLDDYKTPLHESAGVDLDGDGKADPAPAVPATPGPSDDGSLTLE